MRHVDEPITVSLGGPGAVRSPFGTDPETPSSFIWQGRSYVVREVTDHWHGRFPWWRDPSGDKFAEPTGSQGGDLCEQVWRVRAAPSGAAQTMTVDLGHSCSWRLLRAES
ncbi:hypothetical protein KEM60_02329 [Austwickia sp. TVS 96-490-7B]|uniref:DUF6504 family protein n=1 Tax=Austwickia sp. TVS 96-490-7B TaxID=2830843 RepID=UPI001C5A435D|nr:DUF6504 family protein [Austwickia sp. TVS 96-490-7B]MBW3086118.1 hypothetical protein [Austwickia sp. TVS 96-490-7B]